MRWSVKTRPLKHSVLFILCLRVPPSLSLQFDLNSLTLLPSHLSIPFLPWLCSLIFLHALIYTLITKCLSTLNYVPVTVLGAIMFYAGLSLSFSRISSLFGQTIILNHTLNIRKKWSHLCSHWVSVCNLKRRPWWGRKVRVIGQRW